MAAPKPRASELRFREAIDFFARKRNLPSARFDEVRSGLHAEAFTAAGATSEALLADLRAAVDRVIQGGVTLADFRRDFDEIVARTGWKHTGTAAWRARVIYETNMRTAFMAGRWAQIQRAKTILPYLRYVTRDDDRVRFEHAQWHNIVLPADHPFWKTHYPPNGWGCRCDVEPINARGLRRLGLKVTAEDDPRLNRKRVTRPVRTGGQTIQAETEPGIDPFWDYNAGIAGEEARIRRVLAAARDADAVPFEHTSRDQALPPLPVHDPPSPPLPYDDSPRDRHEVAAIIQRLIGGRSRYYADPLGDFVLIGDRFVEHVGAGVEKRAAKGQDDNRLRYLPWLVDLVTAPSEIWFGMTDGDFSDETALPGERKPRRRYIKQYRYREGGKAMPVMLVVDFTGRVLSALTMIRGETKKLKKLNWRGGTLLYRAPDVNP
jgi:SPP1 gp7 family putative phage head morphogenesis protein